MASTLVRKFYFGIIGALSSARMPLIFYAAGEAIDAIEHQAMQMNIEIGTGRVSTIDRPTPRVFPQAQLGGCCPNPRFS